jgi:hypothetical protein
MERRFSLPPETCSIYAVLRCGKRHHHRPLRPHEEQEPVPERCYGVRPHSRPQDAGWTGRRYSPDGHSTGRPPDSDAYGNNHAGPGHPGLARRRSQALRRDSGSDSRYCRPEPRRSAPEPEPELDSGSPCIVAMEPGYTPGAHP